MPAERSPTKYSPAAVTKAFKLARSTTSRAVTGRFDMLNVLCGQVRRVKIKSDEHQGRLPEMPERRAMA